jgi:hypothetical protein
MSIGGNRGLQKSQLTARRSDRAMVRVASLKVYMNLCRQHRVPVFDAAPQKISAGAKHKSGSG